MASDAERRAERIALEPMRVVGRRSPFFSGTGQSLAEIWSQRELLGLLVRREVRARYKDSTLGILWSLFRPIVSLLIYYFAIGQILGLARAIPDFAIFVFVGLTTWGLFNEVVASSTTSLLSNAGLVKKVYLPREIYPLSAVGGAMFNFFVQFLVLLAAIFVLASVPTDERLLLAPLAIIMLTLFSTAVGLILAGVNVYLRDTQHLVEVALVVLFWASPIVYSFTFVHDALQGGWLEELYLANPVTIAVISMQRSLWAAGDEATGAFAQTWPENLELRLLVMLVVSVGLLWLAQRIFNRLQGNFAQEL